MDKIKKMMQKRFSSYEKGRLTHLTTLSEFTKAMKTDSFASYKQIIVNCVVKIRIVLNHERP